MPGVVPEIPDLFPGSAAHIRFSLMQLLWTELSNYTSYLSVARSDRRLSLPFKGHSAVELQNMPRILLCSESNILTIRAVIQHMIKVILQVTKLTDSKTHSSSFIVSLTIPSRGVPAETGLPCDKAAVLEEPVNETPSISYAIKTQLKEKLGKTRN